ncbi:MAG: ATP-dependent helicase UvrD/PcrA [Frankiales bacterium]|jgi:DNA helicase-2/ATP-dependent DNA helicase PcrA|nr:ATP-dependent helicase UvrD/PcrA [Frankiales bacterium]
MLIVTTAPAQDLDRVLDALDPEQRAVAEALRGPVCVLAGAGTGKTRAITHRIAHAVLSGTVPPGQILAVTFTARAAAEMRARLHALGLGASAAGLVQARTFHAAALRQLSYFHPRVIGGPLPRLLESKARLVQIAAGRCRLTVDRVTLRDLTAEVEWAKAMLVPAEGYADAAVKYARRPPLDPSDVARVATAYEEVKSDEGVCDFEDVLLLTAAAIESSADVAGEVRERYRWFVVDEYQDVNPLQQRLLDAWLGDRTDICVVGDASQTIYSFTGATPAYLLDFRRRFPTASVVRLVRDYRSTPEVVTLANRLLAASAERLELIAQQPPGPAPAYAGYPDEPAEAVAVARRCRQLIDSGVTASEIAVLFRTNAQSEIYEQALADADIPYVVRGGERFFDRAEVREAVRLLRGAARSSDSSGPMSMPDAVRHVLATAGWTDEPPPGPGAKRERWDGLAAIVRLAVDVATTDASVDLPGFVALLAERVSAQHPPTVDGVTLASLHAAKGLEWDAVFLVGLVDGTVPIAHATTTVQIDEERRLLYVGVTRARRHISLSWAYARAPGGRASRSPSRFLDGLIDGVPHVERKRPRRAHARCRVCGKPLQAAVDIKLARCSTCPSDIDDALFEQLRTWRKERATAAGKPAFTVFTDATLTAIAEQRPTTRETLLAISGVGPAKFREYGEDVLTLCGNSRK